LICKMTKSRYDTLNKDDYLKKNILGQTERQFNVEGSSYKAVAYLSKSADEVIKNEKGKRQITKPTGVGKELLTDKTKENFTKNEFSALFLQMDKTPFKSDNYRIDKQSTTGGNDELANIVVQNGGKKPFKGTGKSDIFAQCHILRKPVETKNCDELKDELIDSDSGYSFYDPTNHGSKENLAMKEKLNALVIDGLEKSLDTNQKYVIYWTITKT